MTPFDALLELPQLVADYKAMAVRLMEADAKLASLKNDRYVSLDWIGNYWDVSVDTARDMIRELAKIPGGKEVRVLSYGSRVVRYYLPDILRITDGVVQSLSKTVAIRKATRAARKG